MKHDAYVDSIDGGWTGYQGACRDCHWRGDVRPSHPDGKLEAQEDAAVHRAEAPDVPVDVSRLHSGW